MFRCCISQAKILKDRALFHFALLIMTLISVLSFFINVLYYYGYYIPDTKAFRDLVVFGAGNFFSSILVIILPILSAVAFSDTYIEDKNKNRLPILLQLCTKKQYYFSKLLVSTMAGFLVLFIPMSLNLLLNAVAFPGESFADLTGLASNQDWLYSQTSEFMLYMPFKDLFISKPFFYCFLFVILISTVSAAGAAFAYSLSYFFKTRVFSYLPFFIVFNATAILSGSVYDRTGIEISLSAYITSANAYAGIQYTVFLAAVLILLLFPVVLAPLNIKKLGDVV